MSEQTNKKSVANCKHEFRFIENAKFPIKPTVVGASPKRIKVIDRFHCIHCLALQNLQSFINL